ncbi:MAG: hypothetical protein U0792_11300 [Gemmataceae bacterium]
MKVDLIVGLPGDTPESVRRSFRYLRDGELYSDVQVFNLAILPGTAFRQEAAELGLRFQPRPPYYVLETPTLRRTDLFALMQEAQELFAVEFDAQTPPVLEFASEEPKERVWLVDLDAIKPAAPPPKAQRAQAFTVWFTAECLDSQAELAAECVRQLLAENPHTTLQIVLDVSRCDVEATMQSVTPRSLEVLLVAALERPTYLDKYYALQPGRANGAKRLVVVLPGQRREELDPEWLDAIGATASLVWRGVPMDEATMDSFEYAWPG